MSSSLKILAPAKVNIGLKVLHNRKDGFHNIESIFQTVDLCDELEVSLLDESDKKNICDVECDSMILPAENTITKAYAAFCGLTGFDDDIYGDELDADDKQVTVDSSKNNGFEDDFYEDTNELDD